MVGSLVNSERVARRAGLVALAMLAAANILADVAKALQVAHLGLVNAVNTIGGDWTLMSTASNVTLAGGNPYAGTEFMWPPLGAIAFYPAALMGWHLWQIAHLVGALAMPTWRLRIVVLVAFPFWWDVELGNILTFVLLAAVWAIRGNRIAILIFLALTILVPRPLMIPIAAWILWKEAWTRAPFFLALAGSVAVTAAIGLLVPFVARSFDATSLLSHHANVAPSHLIGAAWIAIAAPISVWLFSRHRLGLASLFAAPYWFPYYLLMGLADVDARPLGGRQMVRSTNPGVDP